MQPATTRREFLTLLTASAAAGLGSDAGWAQASLPARAIPGTAESLPIIGLGSTRPVTEIAEHGAERVEAIVRTLGGARRQGRGHVAAQRGQRRRVRADHQPARFARPAVRDDQPRADRSAGGHRPFRPHAAPIPARFDRPRERRQPDGSRRAVAEPQGLEGRRDVPATSA